MNSAPLVSVIIPTYHDWERLSACVRALEAQTYPSDLFEVIIVNNDPEDTAPDSFPLLENFKIIDEAKQGSYAARNAALAIARGDIIGFTDSDCIPDPTWIKAAIKFFDENPDMDRLGGNVKLFISGDKHTLAEAYETIYAFRQEMNIKEGMSVTANMFAKKKVFDKVGFFNAAMISGGDHEWGIRANASNFRIAYSSDVIVNHPARKHLKQLINKVRRCTSKKIYNDYSRTDKFLKIFSLLYEVRPPINEFRYIYNRGKQFSFRLKLLIFFLRYHIRVLRAYEEMKLYSGAVPFDDSVRQQAY